MCHCGAARESDTHLDVVEQAKIVLCGEQTDSLRPVTPPLSIMRMRHSHARRLFESFASRVERLRSIDLAVARTPARTCVSAIDPKASTESSRYQTSPLSLGSDHQSSREGTDCLPLHQSAIQKLPSSLIGLLSTPALETTRAFEHRSEFSLFSPPPAPCFQNHISCKATKAPADRRGLNSNLLCHFSHRPPTYGAILGSSSRPPAFSHPDSTIAPPPQASAEARTRWGVQLTCTTITDLSFCYL